MGWINASLPNRMQVNEIRALWQEGYDVDHIARKMAIIPEGIQSWVDSFERNKKKAKAKKE